MSPYSQSASKVKHCPLPILQDMQTARPTQVRGEGNWTSYLSGALWLSFSLHGTHKWISDNHSVTITVVTEGS